MVGNMASVMAQVLALLRLNVRVAATPFSGVSAMTSSCVCGSRVEGGNLTTAVSFSLLGPTET